MSSLRILRRPKPDAAAAASGGSSHEPVSGEGVRLIRGEPTPPAEVPGAVAVVDPPGVVDPAIAEAPVVVDDPQDADDPHDDDDNTEVDALFARIRASQGSDEARDADETAPVDVAAVAADEADEAVDGGEVEAVDEVVADDDEAVLQRRDALIEPVTHNLGRKLKRALQDDQNDLLDRLRTQRGKVGVDLIAELESPRRPIPSCRLRPAGRRRAPAAPSHRW